MYVPFVKIIFITTCIAAANCMMQENFGVVAQAPVTMLPLPSAAPVARYAAAEACESYWSGLAAAQLPPEAQVAAVRLGICCSQVVLFFFIRMPAAASW